MFKCINLIKMITLTNQEIEKVESALDLISRLTDQNFMKDVE